MVGLDNLPSEYAEFFVSNLDFNGTDGLRGKLKAAGRILYSFEAKANISRLLARERPDIAHLHNICHQISPSIIDELKGRGVPVVMTLHDYKLTCPAYTLLSNGSICDDCAGGRFYKAFTKNCIKGSRLKSALSVIEMYLHHRVLRLYDKVDFFISPSRFLMDKTREMGFEGRIVHLPNSVDASALEPSFAAEDRTVVYFGRLSTEKGVGTLIEAAAGLNVKLNIIGDGPERARLEAKSARADNIRFLGYKKGNELHEEIKRSMFVVIPSVWQENNPRSVLEAFALGKAVVGARIGGIQELVRDGETGMTFEPGDVADLREKIVTLATDDRKFVKMGRTARGYVEREFNTEIHYWELMNIYTEAINKATALKKLT
jgi:glycosyltransferase involved in cell wall biosynthesis